MLCARRICAVHGPVHVARSIRQLHHSCFDPPLPYVVRCACIRVAHISSWCGTALLLPGAVAQTAPRVCTRLLTPFTSFHSARGWHLGCVAATGVKTLLTNRHMRAADCRGQTGPRLCPLLAGAARRMGPEVCICCCLHLLPTAGRWRGHGHGRT
jgi:hypothetical protein